MLIFTANQLVAHAIGDYILQSDWMASEKTKINSAAAAHALTYTIPFLFLVEWSWLALSVICVTHFIIDRWRLARYVVYAKNFLAPVSYWYDWEDCKGTGYHKSRPDWLAVWLLIIADNLMHIVINGAALYWF